MASVVELSVGKQVWFEGDMWEIASMSAAAAQLFRGDKFRSVATLSLLEGAKIIGDDTQAAEDEGYQPASNVVLSDLSPAQRAKLDHRAAVVRPLLEYNGDVSLKQGLRELRSRRMCRRARWSVG
ncbi:hypothetical protein [Brevibacterium marinum]|uniref:Uncharacterized protein n=1 Tax=Brevibacterium marinum TaxID=418643 RepID=A0A846S5C9_9MICO|nr:hypothetical protein [Brevibacterium marinum]NJC56047.1 hypothetical protein [Brevibacterium marinum]